MRTVAAFLVVAGHFRTLFFISYDEANDQSLVVKAFYLITSLGHPAVIVFFALSGFWVGGSVIRSVADGSFSWARYVGSRLTRLWLVLIPALALTQVLDRVGSSIRGDTDIYLGSADYYTVVPVGGPLPNLGFTETLGNLFFLQSLHVPVLGTNTPLWSLAYEFWYYILFPALMVAFSSKFQRALRLGSASVFVIGCFIAGFHVLSLFPIWAAGAFIAWQRPRLRIWIERTPAVVMWCFRGVGVGLLVIVCAISVAVRQQGEAMDYAVAATATLCIAAYVESGGLQQRVLVPFSNAAEWSYSLYAFHLPVLAFIACFMVPLASERWQLSAMSTGASLLVLATVALVCWLLSLITERRTDAVRIRLFATFTAISLRRRTRRYSPTSRDAGQ